MKKPKAPLLLIEDDQSLRRVLEYSLDQAGYAVTCAMNGEEGLALFNERPFEVVITDVQMEPVDGMTVLKQVKQRKPATAVVVITAYGTIEKAVEAMKAGAFDYLTKPFNREELLVVTQKALEHHALVTENYQLRRELQDRFSFEGIIGKSQPMERVYKLAGKVAPTDATVLIIGESGTGKELLARALHYNSQRRNGPFVPVNCASIPENLLESELFGHVKGAFTGAIRDKVGKFELADGGTFFLDEVGDLHLNLQGKLLRALQERRIERIGGIESVPIDVRVVAATNQDLEERVQQGLFRDDLYYRLGVVPIRLPPLRERREDIPLLVDHFLRKYSTDEHLDIDSEAMEALLAYRWPGNIRELENAIERASILCEEGIIGLAYLPETVQGERIRPRKTLLQLPQEGIALDDIEAQAIHQALVMNNWNQSRAAEFLQVPRHILIYRMKKLGIHKKS